MRPVSTMSSVESCLNISLSGRWIVTGTTASSGDHNIITGRSDFPVALLHQLGQKLGMARFGKTPIVEHVLGDGIGDDGGRHAAITSATARRIEATAAGALDRSGWPGSALTAISRGTTGSAVLKARGGDAGVDGDDRHIEAELLRAAAQEIRIGDDVERRNVEFGAPPPNRQRKVGADARGLAERQCQRLHDGSSTARSAKGETGSPERSCSTDYRNAGSFDPERFCSRQGWCYLYSIIAACRNSAR